MIKNTKHGRTNYRALQPYFEAVKAAGGWLHFTSDGFMDFVVEDLQTDTEYAGHLYSIAHYGTQNGDLMSDPEMVIGVDDGRIIPYSFTNHYIGLYQTVFDETGKRYRPRLMTDLDLFIWQWWHNLEDQGFTPEKAENHSISF